MNLGRALAGPIGLLRVITLILGLLILVLTGISHYEDLKEQLYLSVVIITLFVSLILLIILILDVLPPAFANTLDMSYHVIGGILLFITAAIMLYAVLSVGDLCSKEYYVKNPSIGCPYKPFIPRVIAGALGLLNGIIFLLMGVQIKRTEYI